MCTLGNITVPAGAQIPTDDCQRKCSCVAPPDVTCVQFRDCEKAEQSLRPSQSGL